MALFGNWSGYPIVGWSFDDQEKLIEAIKKFKDDGRSTPTAADYGQKEYDEEIRSASFKMKIPSVVVLKTSKWKRINYKAGKKCSFYRTFRKSKTGNNIFY